MSDTFNPYEAPKADLGEAPLAAEAMYLTGASAGARLLNLIIDSIACRILLFLCGTMLPRERDPLLAGAESFVLSIALTVGYYLVLEGATGRTLGKIITGTRVVNAQGGSPRFAQILGRSFTRLVPFEGLSFLGSSTSGWHDKWSGTVVIKTRP
jgi:uncharacterized RDD family membrane protein YckC